MANAAGQFFTSPIPGNNAGKRAEWLAAIPAIGSSTLLDFEGYTVGTNLNGILLPGGAIFTTSATNPTNSAHIQSAASFFGGSNPIGTKALALTESRTHLLTFTTPVDFFGFSHIDANASTIVVNYVGGTSESFSIYGTEASGDTALFNGIYRNDRPQIASVDFSQAIGGDGSWGLDNLEYGAVPEPATMAILGLGAAALLRRRSRRA